MNILSMLGKKAAMPDAGKALPGRAEALPTAEAHFVNHRPLKGPYPEGFETAVFGLGCFWGAEKAFWKIDGVYVTAVGYAGGSTPNATYREVCSGMTGHNEVVLVVYDPKKVTYAALVKAFFEAHDPTQGMRQGNDIGTQYRSGIYVASEAQRKIAEAARAAYGKELAGKGFGPITTEIVDRPPFYFAEGSIYSAFSLTLTDIPGGGPSSVTFDGLDLLGSWLNVDGSSNVYIAPFGGHNFGPPFQDHYDLGQPSQPGFPGSFVFETQLTYDLGYRDTITWSVATPASSSSSPVPETGTTLVLLMGTVMTLVAGSYRCRLVR